MLHDAHRAIVMCSLLIQDVMCRGKAQRSPLARRRRAAAAAAVKASLSSNEPQPCLLPEPVSEIFSPRSQDSEIS